MEDIELFVVLVALAGGSVHLVRRIQEYKVRCRRRRRRRMLAVLIAGRRRAIRRAWVWPWPQQFFEELLAGDNLPEDMWNALL